MEASKMNFDDIARRNDAWGKAYKGVTSSDVSSRKKAFGKSQGIFEATEGMFGGQGQLQAHQPGATFDGQWRLQSQRPSAATGVQQPRSAFDSLIQRAQQGYQQGVGPLREYVGRQLQPAPGVEGVLSGMRPAVEQWAAQQTTSSPSRVVSEAASPGESSFKRWYDQQPHSGPDPRLMQAARQRLAAEQLGGVPMRQAEAVYQGRRDARDILERAAKSRSPADLAVSPLEGDAANFRALAAIESQNNNLDASRQQYVDWKGRRGQRAVEAAKESPYFNAVAAGLRNQLGGQSPTPEQVTGAMGELASKYNIYSRGRRGADKMNPQEFAMAYFSGGFDPENAEIADGMNVARVGANTEREALVADRERRAEILQANNLLRVQRVMPQDAGLAGAMVAGAAMQGDPIAAQMQMQGAQNEAALQAAREKADVERFAARMGFRGQRLDSQARMAEAGASREESGRRFDAQMAEVGGNRAINEQRLANEMRMADMGVATSLADPVASANQVFRESIDGYVAQGYPRDEAMQRATVDARGAYDAAVSRMNVARGFGVAVPEASEFPSQFSYVPPRVDPGLNDGVRTATVADLIKLYQAASVKGEKLTPERLKEVAAANNLFVDDSVLDEFNKSAARNRSWSGLGLESVFGDSTPESDEVYREIYGGNPVYGPVWPMLGYTPPHKGK
jgi:hypothetical protein